MDILNLPPMEDTLPAPGRRVRQTAPEYAGTSVYHSLYLPTDWERGRKYPVIAEYAGNYAPSFGCTGRVEDAALGYGLTEGKGFIWVSLPYISEDHQENQLNWWGDPKATAAYCKAAISRLEWEFGGDLSSVFICGFSRGAIGVNYIGLQDDEIAGLWKGFITHDHYDGVREWKNTQWGFPLDAYRANAQKRLERLSGRPVLIMQNGDVSKIEDYLAPFRHLGRFTVTSIPIDALFPQIPNEYFIRSHTDRWLLFDNEYTRAARSWLKKEAAL